MIPFIPVILHKNDDVKQEGQATKKKNPVTRIGTQWSGVFWKFLTLDVVFQNLSFYWL